MQACPSCGSTNTKKAKVVRDEGTSAGSLAGVGVGSGGIGIGGAKTRSQTRLAEAAETPEDAFGLYGFIQGTMHLVNFVAAFFVGAFVTEVYEIVLGVLAGLVFLIVGVFLVKYLAAVFALVLMVALGILAAAYLGDNYSYWIGGPVGLIVAGIGLSMTWGNIKNVLADEAGKTREAYERTWMCMTCGEKWED
jgi:hypothetical protein